MDIICNPDASDHETSLWLEISMISEYVPGKSSFIFNIQQLQYIKLWRWVYMD